MASTDEDTVMIDPKVEREQHVVEARTGLGEMPEDALDDFGFAVDRLHDPCNYDHTTIDKMLATYHFRDLQKSKIFRIAKKIFGDKMDSKFKMRTRSFNLTGIKDGCPIIAGSVQKKKEAINYDCQPTEDDEDEDLVDMNDLRLRTQKHSTSTTGQGYACINPDNDVTAERIDEYNKWLEEHKKLRANINSLGLTESWLRNKPDRTDAEDLLYHQILSERYAEREEKRAIAREADRLAAERLRAANSLPRIRRPSPIAIKKLDNFLRTHKLRLIDIFSAIDKDKNWNLSREEFKSAIELLLVNRKEKYGMDISASLLEDLITTLDVDRSGEVSYKELVKGLELYNKEKRDLKNKGLTLTDEDIPENPAESPTLSLGKSSASSRQASGKVLSDKSGSKPTSAHRRQSRGSSASTLLATPEPDLQESRLVLKSTEQQVDLRKRDKNFLHYYNKSDNSSNRQISPFSQSQAQSKMPVFKTGYKPVDDHCKPSRLEGETGAMIDAFRQLKLKEYHNIINLCETEGVALSRKLLDRVLLHPGDKTTKLMLRQGIRQPGANLPLSKHFAEPPKRPRTPIEIRNKGKIKRGKDGKLLIDYKHRFLSQAKAAAVPTKVQLSTGKALISRKVDCWMTFEEYEAMTKKFYTERYVHMEPNSESQGLTWPGYMLDKMRIYLQYDRTADHANPLFREVQREPKAYHGYDNDLNNWQVSDAGYLRQGDLRHPKKYYDTSNLQPRVKPDLTYNNHMVHKNTAQLTMHTKHTLSINHS